MKENTDVIETTIDTDSVSRVKALEDKYNSIKNTYSTIGEDMTSIVKMIDVDGVREMVDNAISKIEKVTGISKRVDKTLRKIPLIGNKLANTVTTVKAEMRLDSSIKDVVNKLFIQFDKKAEEIIKSVEMLEQLEEKIYKENKELETIIKLAEDIISTSSKESDKLKAKRVYEMTKQSIIKNDIKVSDKIKPAIMIAGKSLDTIYGFLPTLKADLLDELAINGAVNKLNDINAMFKEVKQLTLDIARLSSKQTHEAILETVDLMDDSDTNNYIEETLKNRNKFLKEFERKVLEVQNKQIANFEKIKSLQIDKVKTPLIDSYQKEVKSE